jgi:ankyrin repeat protein
VRAAKRPDVDRARRRAGRRGQSTPEHGRKARALALITSAVLAAVAGSALAESSLLDAAKAADRGAALAALERRADPNSADLDGTTPLIWAVHHDDVELVKRLIAAGADVKVRNAYGATPMSEGAIVADVAVLDALLRAGVDVDSANADGQTALMVVVRTSNVAAADLLIMHGANVNAREQRKGQTALMWATAESQPAMVKTLLAHGADANARSTVYDWDRRVTAEPRTKSMPSGGFTPLLYAAREGCLECARELVAAGAQVNMTDPDGITPILSALLNAHFDTAKVLLGAGANPHKWDWWGRTPLYAAVDYDTVPHGGRPDRPSLDETTSLQMIEMLLDADVNVNAQLKLFPPYRSLRMDRGADAIIDIGATPLLRAARAGDVAAMKLLLKHGALVDLPQVSGATPLMVAVGLGANSIDTRGKFRTELDALATAEVLLDAGADVNARDSRGRTALHAAAAQGYSDVAKFLVERGADLEAADADGVLPVDAALGKLRGGRGPGAVHADTARVLTDLASGRPAPR